VYAVIAADYKDAVSSLNQGIPIVIRNPRDTISKGINGLVKKLMDETESKGRN